MLSHLVRAATSGWAVVLTVVGTAAVLCAQPAAAPAITVRFELNDAQVKGRALEGVAISVAPAAGGPEVASGRTGSDGRWTARLPSGTYQVRLQPRRLRALHERRDRDPRRGPARHRQPVPSPRGHGVGRARGAHHPQLGVPARPGPGRRLPPRVPVRRLGPSRLLPGACPRGGGPQGRAGRGRHRLGRPGDDHAHPSRAGDVSVLGPRLQRAAGDARCFRHRRPRRDRGRGGGGVPRLQGHHEAGLAPVQGHRGRAGRSTDAACVSPRTRSRRPRTCPFPPTSSRRSPNPNQRPSPSTPTSAAPSRFPFPVFFPLAIVVLVLVLRARRRRRRG